MLAIISRSKVTNGRKASRHFIIFLTALVCSSPSFSRDVEVVESRYNTIIIHERPPYISMRFGFNTKLYTESVFNTRDALELPVKYTQYMAVSLAYTSALQDILEIGSGGGRFSSYVSATLGHQTNVTTVELDPEVIRLAKKYFGLSEGANLKIKESDGRLFLYGSEVKYNAIFIDAYRGPFVPFHLLTREFYELVAGRLKTDGVLVQNVEPSTMLFDASLATIGSVFENLDIFVAGGNVVVVAYNGEERTSAQLRDRAHVIDTDFSPRYRLTDLLGERRIVDKSRIIADPLTDDFAPAEYLRSIELHNRRYEEITK